MTQFNPLDTITVDVPLFIRLLEYAREDAKTDMDLHNVAENAITLSETGKTLKMTDYDAIIKDGGQEGTINESKTKMKQSINEIKRMQQLAGLISENYLNEASGGVLEAYVIHVINGILFNTPKGAQILGKIMDDYDKEYGNTYMELSGEHLDWFNNHPLHSKFIAESDKAEKMLQKAVVDSPLEALLRPEYAENGYTEGGPAIEWEGDENEDDYVPSEVIAFLEAEGLTINSSGAGTEILASFVGD
jgi:hypothetical protein